MELRNRSSDARHAARTRGRRRLALAFASSWIALGFAFLMALPPSLADAAAPSSRDDSASPEFGFEPTNVGAEYLRQLPRHLTDEAFVTTALLAQFEQQGLLPPGTVQHSRASLRPWRQGAPDFVYRDMYPACDVNADGKNDIVTNDWGDLRWNPISVVRAIDGSDGTTMWAKEKAIHIHLPGWLYAPPARPGMPLPKYPLVPENMAPSGDANGDGVCDFLAFGYDYELLLGFLPVIHWMGSLDMLNGKNGAPLWSIPIDSYWTIVGITFVCRTVVIEIKDFPTGFLSFESPSGPKFVWKTTDILYEYNNCADYEDWQVIEHVMLGNARNGEIIWQRDLPYKGPKFTWISGAGDIGGNQEYEVVLDRFEYDNGNMFMKALRSLDGGDFWARDAVITDQATQSGFLSVEEESRERLVWHHAMVLSDVTGDGKDDPMGLYLTKVYNEPGTMEGRYRTHFVPLEGASGRDLWDGDIKYQGWGFPAPMNACGKVSPFIAIGTVDVPPLLADDQGAHPGGKFPKKKVRMAVLDMADGSALWTYEELYPQDSYLSYDMTLNQYLQALAPHDWDGDCVNDLVTPAIWVRPEGDVQVLMATTTHNYKILRATDGEPLYTLTAWGPKGIVYNCGFRDGEVTVISGHARRMEITRFDTDRENITWRHLIYSNPTPQAQVAGQELLWMGGRCGDTPDNRTMFGINTGQISLRRGQEILGVYGFVAENGSMDWHVPEIPELNILGATVDISLDVAKVVKEVETESSLAELLLFNLGPALPGVGTGLGIGFLRNRRHRKKTPEVTLE